MCLLPSGAALPPSSSIVIPAGSLRSPPANAGGSAPTVVQVQGGALSLNGVLTVIYASAPVAGRYVLIDATGVGYTGRFSNVVLRFETAGRAAFTCFAFDVIYDPLAVAAQVTIPTCSSGMPWWIWVAIAVGALLLIAAIIIIIVVVRRRRAKGESGAETWTPLLADERRSHRAETTLTSDISGFEVPARGRVFTSNTDTQFVVAEPSEFSRLERGPTERLDTDLDDRTLSLKKPGGMW